MSKENFSMSFGLGLLGGIIGGVIAGVIFAPTSGDETRKELQEAIQNAKETYTPKVIEAKDKTIKALDIIKCKLEKQINRINSSIKARQLAKAKIIENGHYELD